MKFVFVVLLVGCATLQRTPLPPGPAVVVVVTGSSCPEYRLAIREDGLVEYWSDRTARVTGVGWLRVDVAVVERLRRLPLIHPRKIVDIEAERGWCRAFDVSATGVAISGPQGWTGQCEVRPDQEVEILTMLGVAKWLQAKPDERCRWGA